MLPVTYQAINLQQVFSQAAISLTFLWILSSAKINLIPLFPLFYAFLRDFNIFRQAIF